MFSISFCLAFWTVEEHWATINFNLWPNLLYFFVIIRNLFCWRKSSVVHWPRLKIWCFPPEKFYDFFFFYLSFWSLLFLFCLFVKFICIHSYQFYFYKLFNICLHFNSRYILKFFLTFFYNFTTLLPNESHKFLQATDALLLFWNSYNMQCLKCTLSFAATELMHC